MSKTYDQISARNHSFNRLKSQVSGRHNTISGMIEASNKSVSRAVALKAVVDLIDRRRQGGKWRWSPISLSLNRGGSGLIEVLIRHPSIDSQTVSAAVYLQQDLCEEIQDHISAISDLLMSAATLELEEARALSLQIGPNEEREE